MSVRGARTVLITGCNGGIGQAIVDACRSNGWFVVGTDMQESSPACDVYIPADLTDPRAPQDIARMLRQQTGDSLNALINNAACQIVKPLTAITHADYQRLTAVNIAAPFFLIQALLPLLQAGRGAVVNVGSIHSRLSKPEFSLYALSKGALTTMTRALALELAPQVRINAVLPAAVATPMLQEGFAAQPEKLEQLAACHPLERIAAPAEIAHVVCFLIGPHATFMTGATVAVDGGIGGRLYDP